MNCTNCDTPLPTNSRFCLSCGLDLSDPGSGPRTGVVTGDLQARLARVLEGRYRVTRILGRGGMGVVFLAEDQTLERPVAIKVLPPEVSHDENLVGRFEREARTAAKLDHPNIIPIFSVESADDLHFFVMKFVSGQPLDEVLDEGVVSIEHTQQYLWEAAVALGHAHRRGVVHRDIKPANVMLDHDGRVMLTDFGISKAMQSATQLTGTGQVIGTPHYMSPEQARGGEVDGRSDQYSLGVLGYQLVAGRRPFEDSAVHALIFKHVTEEPQPVRELNPDCPPFIAAALHRALAKLPDERFDTMEDFARAICPDRRLSASTGMTAEPIRTSDASEVPTEIASTSDLTQRRAPRTKRRSFVVAAMFVLAMAGAGGGGWAWSQGMLDPLLTGDTLAPPPAAGAVTLVAAPPVREPLDSAAGVPGVSDTGSPPVTIVSTPPAQDPGRPTPRPVQPPAAPAQPSTGFITVDATPWGTVYIDDFEIQDTPLVRHEIVAGQHIIRIAQNNCADAVDTVTVVAGGTARKSFVLSCGSRP